MPLFGTLDPDKALETMPTVAGFNPATWELPDSEVLQVSYEVAEDPALALTPPALHPSIPPYATFSFWRCPEGPAGAFNLAMVRLIVRAGIRPRALLIQGFVDNAQVADELATGWGYKLQEADVQLSRRHNRVAGTVQINGATVLEARLEDPEPVVPTDIELFDNLHLANVEGDDAVIAQIDPGYTYRSADRGKAEVGTYVAEQLGTVGIEPVYPLVGVACGADIELAAPRFVMDPRLPAFQGTRRLANS